MNKDCNYFREHFPDLLIEPDIDLVAEWESHKAKCKECADSFRSISQQQDNALVFTKQLIKSIPVPCKLEIYPKTIQWKKYLIAAIVLILFSLQFYLFQLGNTPNLREKIVQLLEKELMDENISDHQKVIDRLIVYGSNFYYDFQKLASLAEVYQNKLGQSSIVFTKTRLLLNSRVYIHTIDQAKLKKLITENNPVDIKNDFSRAIENIGTDEVTKSMLMEYFCESLPYLLALRIHQDELLSDLSKSSIVNLSQNQQHYILWKIEQYFIKNIY